MAVIETPRTHATAGVVGHTLAHIAGLITAWFDARATRRALMQLSDRELDDIGLTRADISRIGIHH